MKHLMNIYIPFLFIILLVLCQKLEYVKNVDSFLEPVQT